MTRILRFILGIMLLLLGTIALFGKEELFRFLAPTGRVNASVLVVEGWISQEALRQVITELQDRAYEQVIVTSVAHDASFRMYSRGGLIFQVPGVQAAYQTLSVQAFGTPAGGIQAHARVRADTTLVGEFMASSGPAWYTFPLPGPMSVDSVTVVFDNDGRVGKEDRDLYLYAIRLDTLRIPARHPAVRYDRGKLDGKTVFRTDYAGIAQEAREFLVTHGANPDRLLGLTAPRVAYERTYTSALAVKQALGSSVTAVNIFSESVHARRSRLVYRKTLGDSVQVGIIAAFSNDEQPDRWWRQSGSRNYVLLQLVKYLYARFFFFPSSGDSLEETKN